MLGAVSAVSRVAPATRLGAAIAIAIMKPQRTMSSLALQMESAADTHERLGDTRLYSLPKAWTSATLDRSKITYTFGPEAAREMTEFVKEAVKAGTDVNTIQLRPWDMPRSAAEMEWLEEKHLINGEAFAVLKPIPGLDSIPERRIVAFVQAQMLGETPAQNAEGVRAIQVYNRDDSKRMKDGQRYHQSREGGSIHTDNVNIPELWDYMSLTCLQSAHVGGESILCSVATVHNYLQSHAPEALDVLREDFWWEYRGFSDKFFRAPVLFYNKQGEPLIRYLRDYMESAYARQGLHMSHKQRWALDLLDSVCELSEVQFRYNLQPGETLVANDTQLLHGRTSFVDRKPATQTYDMADPVNRLYQRVWLRKYKDSIGDMQL